MQGEQLLLDSLQRDLFRLQTTSSAALHGVALALGADIHEAVSPVPVQQANSALSDLQHALEAAAQEVDARVKEVSIEAAATTAAARTEEMERTLLEGEAAAVRPAAVQARALTLMAAEAGDIVADWATAWQLCWTAACDAVAPDARRELNWGPAARALLAHRASLRGRMERMQHLWDDAARLLAQLHGDPALGTDASTAQEREAVLDEPPSKLAAQEADGACAPLHCAHTC